MEVLFKNLPQIEPVGDECWRLLADFKTEVDGVPIVVGAGFVTDGASIPRFLWRLCGHPMSTKRLPAAVLHDFLYQEAIVYNRAECDEIYRDGLVTLGFPKWKAYLEYYALRRFGGSHWGEQPKENT